MSRDHLAFALLAFAAYSLVAPLTKVAMVELPSTPVVFVSNFVLFVLVGGVLLWRRESPWPYIRHRFAPLIVVSGVLLTVGLLTYYRALALGPVSIVVPIYGLFIVVSAAVGVVAFDEAVTPRKLAGIAASVVAIALISI